MKILFFSLLILFVSVKADEYKDFDEFWKNLTEMLETIAKLIPLSPDANRNISELIDYYGYPYEEHTVTTEDGYILTMHRIQYGRNKTDAEASRPVAFFNHGMGGCSMQYVNGGPDRALGMMFADAGYDVWMVNTRGTTYATHQSLTEKDSDYWDYSFHEKAIYDLPVSIDYVITTTGQESVTYIGHSEGTTEGLILTSTKPEYNDKINLMVLLSPVAYMSNLTSPLVRLASQQQELIETILNLLNIHGIPFSPVLAALAKIFCNDASSLQNMCVVLLDFVMGFDIYQLDKSFIPVIANSMPAGTSVKEMIHYGQGIKSGLFRQYDYGILNLYHYGTFDPPSYDMQKVTCPVASYYGKNDYFAAISDVEQLLHELPNKATSHLIDYEYFNHIDFVFSKDLKELIFDKVIEVVQKYNPTNPSPK
ncbi:hypothetical protein GWI33_013659 [Rhynchophorus ferrugineus]|uniref:Lipase n=1 Tax=Rhynchophorus ferrugineus TaxID=354439 RepID=A0A834M7L3_RHYFE|nr:hypothetical protein GWI33_013659 [Rhynchophorus ferrugineus]